MTDLDTHSKPKTGDLEGIDLDCTGLLCPLPVYKAALVLNAMSEGELLRLVTTDPGALRDIPAMAKQRGDTLLEVVEADGSQSFLIAKGAVE